MTVSISGVISESNVNISNNTSDVTVQLYATWNSGSYAADNPAGFIIIDGTQYDFNANFNIGRASSGSELIQTKSKTVTHESDGTKTVSCSASYDGIGSYTVTWSDTKTLTTIARTSALADISDFNLEDSFSVATTKHSSSFTDKLEILSGSTVIKTVDNYTTGAAITLADNEILSAYRNMGTNETATFTFKISTYNGSTLIGFVSKNGSGKSAGTMQYNNNGIWVRALPYVNVNGTWKKALAMNNVNSDWKRGKI